MGLFSVICGVCKNSLGPRSNGQKAIRGHNDWLYAAQNSYIGLHFDHWKWHWPTQRKHHYHRQCPLTRNGTVVSTAWTSGKVEDQSLLFFSHSKLILFNFPPLLPTLDDSHPLWNIITGQQLNEHFYKPNIKHQVLFQHRTRSFTFVSIVGCRKQNLIYSLMLMKDGRGFDILIYNYDFLFLRLKWKCFEIFLQVRDTNQPMFCLYRTIM